MKHAGRRVRARRGRHLHFVLRRAAVRPPLNSPDAAPAPARHRLYDAVDGRLVRRTSRDRRERRADRRRRLVGQQQPDLLLLNEGDLASRQDPPRRALARHRGRRPGDPRRLLARALCWGAAWDMTRDAEMSATDFVALAQQHRQRDRRVRRLPIPRVRRACQHLLPAPAHRDAVRATWEQGCAPCSTPPRPAARPPAVLRPGLTPALPTARARSPTSRACRRLVSFDGLAADADLRWTLLKALLPATAAPTRTGSRPSRARQHDLRSGAGGGRPGDAPRPPRPAEAWEIAMVREGRRAQRDPAQRRAGLPAVRQDEVLAPYRREVTSRPPTRCGRIRHAARLDRAGVHSQAAGEPRSCSTGSMRIESSEANPAGALRP